MCGLNASEIQNPYAVFEYTLTLTLPSPYVGMGGSLTVTVA